ncbi:hypothetical protein [Actinomadura parmotrematis]|uniref:TFIIB-type zinc ribbon-containing protein n=1 Tax=Actinomadura parmotrematis TaxID=2864039 RepID=A0ABS7FZD3_9ACTN|nr:hypothetical protein [Actinomadura parmotrematis]MBW8485807.1 hypothetical protein [Actinomadura parmotrematis]
MREKSRGAERFRDPGTRVYAFTERVLVRCPGCGGCAVVLVRPDASERLWIDRVTRYPRRLHCPGCGLFRETDSAPLVIGAPVDPYFRLPLWLRAPCRGHELWAYNLDHLALLEDYVAARLRERGPYAQSMLAKLPAWVKSGQRRDEIVRAVGRLRASVPDSVRERHDDA